MLTTIAISNYRSLRNLVVPLLRLNVVTGANGSGKSSLYRALRLLGDTAQGRVVSSLAREGGLPSTLWAGPEKISRAVRSGQYEIQGTPRKKVVSLQLGFASDEFGYLIDLGLPAQAKDSPTAFKLDPEIKRECIWHGPVYRGSTALVDRRGPIVKVKAANDWNIASDGLTTFDSMMTLVADPQNAPEILAMRESIRAWRFYDHFRTDADAPVRQAQIGTRTTVLGNDGADLASAIQTIREIGDAEALDAAVEDAFAKSRIRNEVNAGRFSLLMEQQGLLRPLAAAELSDGTLRYLLWVAALLTPRPPALMVLNEPETSLHPDLLGPLGRLIAQSSQRAQMVVVTHAAALIAALGEHPTCNSLVLDKSFGETGLKGVNALQLPAWNWPER